MLIGDLWDVNFFLSLFKSLVSAYINGRNQNQSDISLNFNNDNALEPDVAVDIPYHNFDLNIAVVELGNVHTQPGKTVPTFKEIQSKEVKFDLWFNIDGYRDLVEDCCSIDRNQIGNYQCDIPFRERCGTDGSIVFEKEVIEQPGVLGSICLAKSDGDDDTHAYNALAMVTDMSSPYKKDDNQQQKRLYRALKMSKISQELKGVLPSVR